MLERALVFKLQLIYRGTWDLWRSAEQRVEQQLLYGILQSDGFISQLLIGSLSVLLPIYYSNRQVRAALLLYLVLNNEGQ